MNFVAIFCPRRRSDAARSAPIKESIGCLTTKPVGPCRPVERRVRGYLAAGFAGRVCDAPTQKAPPGDG